MEQLPKDAENPHFKWSTGSDLLMKGQPLLVTSPWENR